MSFKLGTPNEQIVAVSADYTVGPHDDLINVSASGAQRAITLDSSSNEIVAVRKTDSSANAVVVTATINGASNYSLTAQNQCAIFRRTATGLWYCIEDNSANAVIGELNALAAVIPTTTVAALTENSGAIGGTNDGNLPDLTATYVARTGSNSGTANGALEAEGTLSTAGGNTYTDAAVNTILSKIENNITEALTVIAQLAADNVALRAAARENAAQINTILARLKTALIIA